MKLNRLNPLAVAGIGTVLSILAAVGIFFLLIKPTLDAKAVQQGIYDQNYPDSTLASQHNAQKALAAAKQKVQDIKFQWLVKSAAKMPRYDVSNRTLALKQITQELTQYLPVDLQRQLHTTGVRTDTVITLPAPPVSPNDITAAPIVIPLGTITVTGDFRHILNHFYAWRNFNRLVLADNLALSGTSPYMTGTYTATLYIFPQNDDKLGPIIPQAGGGTGAGAPGAGSGGRPGGSGGFRPGGGPSSSSGPGSSG